MKTCPNCRVVYEDEYAGQCHECGKPLGSVAPNGAGEGRNLAFDFARQVQDGARESAQETSMKRGNYDGVKVQPSIIDVARNFITVDREKYIEAGGDPNDLR